MDLEISKIIIFHPGRFCVNWFVMEDVQLLLNFIFMYSEIHTFKCTLW